MNMDLVLMLMTGIGLFLMVGLAVLWTMKLTRQIPSNFEAIHFEDLIATRKSCLWWK